MKTLTPMAQKIFETYLSQKDSLGRCTESLSDLFHRVARFISKAEAQWSSLDEVDYYQEEYYRMMNRGEFYPSLPVLRHSGQEKSILVDSFVLALPDSIAGIAKALPALQQIHQSGGTVGISFSDLRPKDDVVSSTGGAASGVVEFFKIIHEALQSSHWTQFKWPTLHFATLRLDHPEIFDFLELRQKGECPSFQFAVGVTSHFMRCLKKGTTYPLVNPRTGKIIEFVSARKIYEKVCAVGSEKGLSLLFLDEINRHQSTPHLGRVEAASAGGAQPLLPNEGAALGAINLSTMIREGSFDEERFEIVVDLAMRFLDNVIDLSAFPNSFLHKLTRENRKIGLGIMGFADLLEQLKVPYDSAKARSFATYVMKLLFKRAKQASMALAKQRGAFANFANSTFEKGKGNLLRNASLLTLADHAVLAALAGVSAGVNPKPDANVSVSEEIKMQAIFQKYTDNGVGKQIQLSSLKDLNVQQFFMEAYENKCKIITVVKPEGPVFAKELSKTPSTMDLKRNKTEEGVHLQKPSEFLGFAL